MLSYGFRVLSVVSLSAVFTGLSLLRFDYFGADGFFSLHQGPSYYGHGFPLMFLRRYQDGSWDLIIKGLCIDLGFWLVIAFFVIYVILLLFRKNQ